MMPNFKYTAAAFVPVEVGETGTAPLAVALAKHDASRSRKLNRSDNLCRRECEVRWLR
jgi:hypothetical protein